MAKQILCNITIQVCKFYIVPSCWPGHLLHANPSSLSTKRHVAIADHPTVHCANPDYKATKCTPFIAVACVHPCVIYASWACRLQSNISASLWGSSWKVLNLAWMDLLDGLVSWNIDPSVEGKPWSRRNLPASVHASAWSQWLCGMGHCYSCGAYMYACA